MNRCRWFPSRMIDWDTPSSAAIALRDWNQKCESSVQRINVVTEDTHARRTRLLFQKAFGRDVQVGIIARGKRGLSREPMVALERRS
jgi:uncharacterized SAM-binding protein YcdF (DUF218 family)